MFVKKIAISIIKSILWLIDKDHRKKYSINDEHDLEITHSYAVDFQSDFGRVNKIFRTVPYALWELKTKSFELYAADRHIVINEFHKEVWICNLKVGDKIKTKNGIEEVTSVRSLGIRTHMYDMEVITEDPNDPMNHLFYSNGILSHNSTAAACFILWKVMFTPDTTVLIAANKWVQAMEIMSRIKFGYENMEWANWIRAGVEEYNKGTITFDNGSKIVARATTPDAGRGLSISLLYMDEFAFVPPRMAEEFWVSIQPTLSSGGDCIVTSTPNGDTDQFSTIWRAACRVFDENGNPVESGLGENGFKAEKVSWDKHPDRDGTWEKKYRSLLGDEKFEREMNCEFISAEDTLINGLTLKSFNSYISKPLRVTNNNIRWYKDISPGSVYIVGLDPSLGLGNDYSTIQVFELPSMEQVAEWRDNTSPTKTQVTTLLNILNIIHQEISKDGDVLGYPEIYWSIENNTLGEAPLNVIRETGEEKFPGTFVHEPKQSRMGNIRRKGLTTTNRNKVAVCTRLKHLAESGKIRFSSGLLIHELKNYINSGASFKARQGETDDLVSSLLVVLRIIEIISKWNEEASDCISQIIDSEESYLDPLPVVV